MNEYKNVTTNYPPAAYFAMNTKMPAGEYIIPNINPVLPYDTLVKGNSWNGYANIITAYGADAQNCYPTYSRVNCNGDSVCPSCVPANQSRYYKSIHPAAM